MNKLKFGIFAGIVGAVAVISIMAAQADTTPLVVTCAGGVSNNQITWTASPTGGNSPYSLVWSGDASVAGNTSTVIDATYSASGTYTAMIQAMDASSTIATSTCSATVTSIITLATTGTLNVFLSVNNSAGGSATPSNFAVSFSGAGASPGSFSGDASGTAVTVNGSSTYTVTVTPVANYTGNATGNCGGPIAGGGSDSCSIVETFVQPVVTSTTPTSTPPLPRANPPSLSISPDGAFFARGMTVTSVSSGSFQGTVWGITYTVNWSGNLHPQFYYRNGNGGSTATDPTQQVAVGDEVGVSGKITSGNPLVVNANVVRDYSITMPRQRRYFPQVNYGPQVFGGHGNNGGGSNNENRGNNNSSSVGTDFNTHITDLMNQLRNLQNLFKSRGGR